MPNKARDNLAKRIHKVLKEHKDTGWGWDKNGETFNMGCKCGWRAHNINSDDYYATRKAHDRHLSKVIADFILSEA